MHVPLEACDIVVHNICGMSPHGAQPQLSYSSVAELLPRQNCRGFQAIRLFAIAHGPAAEEPMPLAERCRPRPFYMDTCALGEGAGICMWYASLRLVQTAHDTDNCSKTACMSLPTSTHTSLMGTVVRKNRVLMKSLSIHKQATQYVSSIAIPPRACDASKGSYILCHHLLIVNYNMVHVRVAAPHAKLDRGQVCM